MGRDGRLRASALLSSALAVLLLSGCEGPNVASGPSNVLLRVRGPLHEPVWSDNALVGLTESGSRVESVVPALDPKKVSSRLSGGFPDAGENLAPGMPGSDVVYLPEPARDDVAVLRVADLAQVGTLRVGPEPDYLATDVGADALLALSRNRTTVTGRDLEHKKIVASQRVDATAGATIDGPKRERVVEFHVTSDSGIEHYLAGVRRGSIRIRAGDVVGDETKVTRLYVAELGTDRLVAVDSGRASGGLQVVGHAEFGAPVQYVDDDAHRIYAATSDTLVVLETRSFGGYVDGRIPVLETIHFRDGLPPALRSAPLSGMADGPDRVYLTFSGQPYVLSIAKPNV